MSPPLPRDPAVLIARCKVNLRLDILGRRPDGYHELETLFCPLPDPHDTLTVEILGQGRETALTCSDPDLSGPDNLVLRAWRAYAAKTGFAPPLRIHLEKRIPHGAGLGGGSSDAAALLAWLNAAAGHAALSGEALSALAAGLGADLPFFLLGRPALAKGIGERLTPVDLDLSGLILLLVCPPVRVATAWAYAAHDAWTSERRSGQECLTRLAAGTTGSVSVTGGPIRNSFEPAVFEAYPELRRIKENLLGLGAAAAGLSGSGAALFGLFRDEALAEKAALSAGRHGARVFVHRFGPLSPGEGSRPRGRLDRETVGASPSW